MGMPEVSAGIISSPLISKGIAFLNRTLRDIRHTIRVLRALLMDPVPMDRCRLSFHSVFDIDDHFISLAYLSILKQSVIVIYRGIAFHYLYTRAGQHSVCGENSSFDTVGQNALAIAPNRVRCIRGTHLTRPIKNNKKRLRYLRGVRGKPVSGWAGSTFTKGLYNYKPAVTSQSTPQF